MLGALQAANAALQRGDWDTALQNGRTAVALAPDHPAARSLLGLSLLQLGRTAEAVAELERAIQRDKNNAGLLGNLAQAYVMAGRHADAHQMFRRAQRLAPAHWPFAQGAAIALAQQGDPAAAETLLRRITERHAQESVPWHNLGNVQLELGKPADAESSLRTALRLDPGNLDARLSLGSALHRQSQFSAAESAYRECIAAQPDWIAPRLNLVSVLIDDGRFAAAATECATLIGLAPDLAEAHRFFAAALGHQGRLAEALASYRRAADCAPDDALTRRSYGGSLADNGYLHAARRVLAQADALEPDALGMAQLRSMIELAHGLFNDGWAAYCQRPAYLFQSKKWADARITQTLADDLSGHHVLVRREQGLGDELFFLRHLPQLMARGARVTVQASTRIAPMLGRAGIGGDITFIPDSDAPPNAADIHIFCGDLPHALQNLPSSPLQRNPLPAASAMRDFNVRLGAFYPQPAPSLRIPALAEAVARMQQQLSVLGPPPYTGITWRAGTAARDQRGADWALSKEVPLAALGAVLRGGSGTLIALQRHPAAGEIDALATACGRLVADLTAINDALEDMLALLHLLDDYIGVSNTNMHLRAAVGRSARVLVPNPAEWRWMRWGRESPWFPGFRCYRQSLQGDWSGALAELARELAARPRP